MRILAGHDNYVAEWAGLCLGVQFHEPYTAFGFLQSDELKGAVVFTNYYPGGNVETTYVGPHSFRRQQLSFMARFAFHELACSRVTARTQRGNNRMRDMLVRLGFQYEGTQSRYFGPNPADDGITFVLWPAKATRWLKVN